MAEDLRKLCLNCAWRANCNKRFSMAGDGALHCPDFCEDVTLRRQKRGEAEPAPGEE